MPRNVGAYSQAVRLLKILEDLRARSQGALLSDLAEEYQVTERQIRRDLEAIEQAGYDLQWKHDGRRSRVAMETNGKLHLTIGQRYALLAARRVFDVLRDTPLAEQVDSAYNVIVSSLPALQKENIESIRDRFVHLPNWGTKIYDGHAELLDTLLDATLRRWPLVRCAYQPPDGEPFEMVLHPYAMVLYKQGIYVIGSSLRARAADPELVDLQTPRIYAAERFTLAEYDRARHFETPPGFDVDRFFDGVFGIFVGGEPQRVEVEFSPVGAHYVESRRWHPSQKLQKLRGGGVRLTMDVVNLTEVVPWVMGWGPLARVRAPASLVERVRREHEAAASAYAAAAGAPTR